ncbi:hypothetical protein DENSPDRAFT_833894, partial [Dentipellis sp. KUC8613]
MPYSSPDPGRTEDEARNLEQLQDVSVKVLEQAVDLLNNSLSSDDQLTYNSKFLPGSTIGKHLRHARDHFALLLACAASQPPHVMSYDTRSRNTPMESSRLAALDAIKDIISTLEDVVPRSRLDTPLTLNAVTPYEQTFQSTFGREVMDYSALVDPRLNHRAAALVRCSARRAPLVDGEHFFVYDVTL